MGNLYNLYPSLVGEDWVKICDVVRLITGTLQKPYSNAIITSSTDKIFILFCE